MLAATQIEVQNGGIAMFIFSLLALTLILVGSRFYLKIHDTIGSDGKAFYAFVVGIPLILCIVMLMIQTEGCDRMENGIQMKTQTMVIRTGIDPNAPPVTLTPEPVEIPVRFKMNVEMNENDK